MELSVSSETTFFNMKLHLEICPEDTRRTGTTGRVKKDRSRVTNQPKKEVTWSAKNRMLCCVNHTGCLSSRLCFNKDTDRKNEAEHVVLVGGGSLSGSGFDSVAPTDRCFFPRLICFA